MSKMSFGEFKLEICHVNNLGYYEKNAEGKKVKFAAATLEGPALTWWNSKIATMGLETVNQMPWIEIKQLVTAKFCSVEEIQRMKHDLWNLKNNQKQGNARSMTTALTEKKASSGSLHVCKRCFTRHDGPCTIKCHKWGKVGHKARYCKEKSVATGAIVQPISTCYDCGEQGHTRNRCPKKVKQEETGEVSGRAYAIKDAESQGLNVVTVNHIFKIDLIPIELGMFNVIIGMDWLVKNNAVIICGEKVVRIPYEIKMLIVESDKCVSRLKVLSCIKARKYVERGCNLFLAHVTKKKPKEKRLKDVPVIRNFPERVFWGAGEELSDEGSPRVIVYGYDGLPMQPVAPPSLDYVPGPEHTPSPDFIPGPEHPPSPVYVPYVPEPEYPKYLVPSNVEEPLENQPLLVDASPTALSPGYVADSDPDEDLDENPEEDHADYPADGGDDDDDEDEDEEPFKDEDDDEDEEHLALTDSPVVLIIDLVPSAEDTEAFETDEAKVERLLALPIPPPSPLTPLSSPLPQIPSLPLPPLPSSLHLPPHVPTSLPLLLFLLPPLPASLFIPSLVDHKEDTSEAELPPRKRLCLTALTSRWQRAEEVGYDTRDVWVDPTKTVEDVAPMTLKGVGNGYDKKGQNP
nr:reverse transcriptase domain-containing protein [Tanacetum cinerariifolium]